MSIKQYLCINKRMFKRLLKYSNGKFSDLIDFEIAIRNQHKNIIKNQFDKYFQYTEIISKKCLVDYAAEFGYYDILMILLDYGCKGSIYAIDIASYNDDLKTVKALFYSGHRCNEASLGYNETNRCSKFLILNNNCVQEEIIDKCRYW
jgi:hypothetical protein